VPTVLSRHIQFWTLSFLSATSHTSFNIVLGQMEKNYISGVKYGLQEWPDDDGYNVDVS